MFTSTHADDRRIGRAAAPALALLSGALLALAAPPAEAQPRGWTVLAERTVADGADRDVVRLPGARRYQAIQICARRRAVDFRDLDVVFGNGGRQDIAVRRILEPGTCTRPLDLAGGRRDIRRIVVNYAAARARGPQPIVTVRGR